MTPWLWFIALTVGPLPLVVAWKIVQRRRRQWQVDAQVRAWFAERAEHRANLRKLREQ